jgi:hypothetical protein
MLGSIAAASAQVSDDAEYRYRGNRRRGNWGVHHHHASTYEEGIQRGFADVVRSKGLANLLNSEAAINYESVRRMQIDNRIYGTDAYFELRRMNRDLRAAERGPRPSTEDLIRYANMRKPNRLSAHQLDSLTGVITWPEILREPQYQAGCKTLEDHFLTRSMLGYLTTAQVAEVKAAIDDIKAELKKNLDNYPSQSYVRVKSFLDSLSYESMLRPN